MSKKLLFLILISIFTSLKSRGDWHEQKCHDIFPEEKRSQTRLTTILSHDTGITKNNKDIKQLNYRVQAWYHSNSDSCSFILRSLDNKRVYTFLPSGELTFTNTKTEKVKTFFNIPQVKQLKLFINNENGAVKLDLPNDTNLFFDPESGRIDSSTTTDFNVSETTNNDLIMNDPKEALITFLFNLTNLNAMIKVQLKNKSCTVRASKIYDYTYNCNPRKVDNGSQFEECLAPVDKIKDAIQKETGQFSIEFINGVKLKPNYLEILKQEFNNSNCPDLSQYTTATKKIEPNQIGSMIDSQDCPQDLVNYFSKELTIEEINHYLRDIGFLAIMKVVQMAKFLAQDAHQDDTVSSLKIPSDKIAKIFTHGENKLNINPLYLKILALQYAYNTSDKKQDLNNSVKLNFAELKILNILIDDSEKDDQKFNKGINQLITIALNQKGSTADRFDQFQLLEKKIKATHKKAIEYLLTKNCHYESQFFNCDQRDKNLNQEYLFEDSQRVLEFFYKSLINLSHQ